MRHVKVKAGGALFVLRRIHHRDLCRDPQIFQRLDIDIGRGDAVIGADLQQDFKAERFSGCLLYTSGGRAGRETHASC